MDQKDNRCSWCLKDPIYIQYHDTEWGVAEYDEKKLFEMLILESMQAGLSWLTILRKREHFRKAFADFCPEELAEFSEKNVAKLLTNPLIIRNKMKIESAVNNARAFLDLKEKRGSFSDYIWQFTDHVPTLNHYAKVKDVPCLTETSKAMAKDLKQSGFAFVGPVTCYSFMQAVGMVNDHLTSCFLHPGSKMYAN